MDWISVNAVSIKQLRKLVWKTLPKISTVKFVYLKYRQNCKFDSKKLSDRIWLNNWESELAKKFELAFDKKDWESEFKWKTWQPDNLSKQALKSEFERSRIWQNI